jgi:hypothetical protein
MEEANEILEHEILKVLYIKTSLYRGGYTRGDGRTVIMAKRDYKDATLYFGTLVDILNLPEKYESDAYKSLQGLDRTQEEINTKKYNYGQVSNAIEVLEFNGQVIDKVIENTPQHSGSRRITLTNKGAIDYRNRFYFKQSESEEIDSIKNMVARIEYRLKKYWLRNEIIKYSITTVLGAILGAAIALLSSQLGHKSTTQSGKQLTITADTIIVK